MISVKNVTKIYKSHVRQNNLLKDIFSAHSKSMSCEEHSLEIEENDLLVLLVPMVR